MINKLHYKISLQPLEERHALLLYEGLQSQNLYKYISDDPPPDILSLRKRYKKLQKRKSPDGCFIWLNWAIYDSVNHLYFGYVQATIAKDSSTADIAYLVFDKYWGHGIAKEALKIMFMRLIKDWGIHCFKAIIDTRNLSSIALVMSLGFELKALVLDADYFKDETSHEYTFENTVL